MANTTQLPAQEDSARTGRAQSAAAATGLAYRNVAVYRLVMRLLYRMDYHRKYQAVADLIPPGATVVDLCAGDCRLAEKLSVKGCTYLGLEVNPGFVKWAQRRGIDARHFDVQKEEIPAADVICMQSSLYQFMPDDEILLGRMIGSARNLVIVSEPVVNLSDSRNSLMSRAAVQATAVNGVRFRLRHSLCTLTRLMERLQPAGELVERRNREAVFIIRKTSPIPHDANPGDPLLQRRRPSETERGARFGDLGPHSASIRDSPGG